MTLIGSRKAAVTISVCGVTADVQPVRETIRLPVPNLPNIHL